MTTTTRPTFREPSLADRFDPRPADEARYETAIARRNTAWSHYRTARELLETVQARPGYDCRPFVQNLNQTQHEWEWAEFDLIRERVRWERAGVPW